MKRARLPARRPAARWDCLNFADKGTLLLDEIGEMSLELQAKLFRVIQHKEVNRIGGSKPIPDRCADFVGDTL